MQEQEDDEADNIQAVADHQEQQVQPEQEHIPVAAAAVPPGQEPQAGIMMISAAAYAGLPSDSTISLLLAFQGSTATALADTGSTNTFMDKGFAIRNNITLTNITARTVTVAGGGQLTSTAVAYNCAFTIQGINFCSDFRILDLPGVDVILGVNWFKNI